MPIVLDTTPGWAVSVVMQRHFVPSLTTRALRAQMFSAAASPRKGRAPEEQQQR